MSFSRQPKTFCDSGIVLRTHKLGETDRIVRLITREHGKRSAVAKGIRKTTSSFSGKLEPFTCSRVLLYEGRTLDILRQAEIEVSFHQLREDLNQYLRASVTAEIIEKMTVEREPRPELFDLLIKGLELLRDKQELADFTLAFFEFRAIAACGYALRVSECANCSSKLDEGYFSIELGGLVCSRCRQRGKAGRLLKIKDRTIFLLQWMAGNELGAYPEAAFENEIRELDFLLEKVLEHWLEREFKSLRVMHALKDQRGESQEEILAGDSIY